MELDFTALNNMALGTAITDFTEPIVHEEGNLALKQKTPAMGRIIALQEQPVHSHRLDAEKQERARIREVYSTYQENIQRAGSLRADILKGIHKGEEPLALLLRAVECISLMTGDAVILEQSKRDILAIYGWGLGEPEPLQNELKNTADRLERLRGATVPPEERERLQNAIRAHEEKIDALQGAIARAEHEEGHKDLVPASDIVDGIIEDIRGKQERGH